MHCVQRETLVETQGDLNRVAQAFFMGTAFLHCRFPLNIHF